MTTFESGIGKQVSMVASAPMERSFERACRLSQHHGHCNVPHTTAKTSSWITAKGSIKAQGKTSPSTFRIQELAGPNGLHRRHLGDRLSRLAEYHARSMGTAMF
jgi:hypothetical protein